MAAEAKLCVVTGGRGFAARHLVEMLLRSRDWAVGVADLAPAIVLDPAEEVGVLGDALRSGRAQYVSVDLRNKAQVVQGVPPSALIMRFLESFQYEKKKLILCR